MEDLKKSFKKEQLTCIVSSCGHIYKEKNKGILPLLHFIEQGVLREGIVVDKVIGKAAAMLMIYGGVKKVHACMISEHALTMFRQHHIPISYDVLVPYIINRSGTGMCPMEESVLACEDIEEAYHILCKKAESMKKAG